MSIIRIYYATTFWKLIVFISSSKQDTKEKYIALCLPVDVSSNRNSPTEMYDRVGSLPNPVPLKKEI